MWRGCNFEVVDSAVKKAQYEKVKQICCTVLVKPFCIIQINWILLQGTQDGSLKVASAKCLWMGAVARRETKEI